MTAMIQTFGGAAAQRYCERDMALSNHDLSHMSDMEKHGNPASAADLLFISPTPSRPLPPPGGSGLGIIGVSYE